MNFWMHPSFSYFQPPPRIFFLLVLARAHSIIMPRELDIADSMLLLITCYGPHHPAPPIFNYNFEKVEWLTQASPRSEFYSTRQRPEPNWNFSFPLFPHRDLFRRERSRIEWNFPLWKSGLRNNSLISVRDPHFFLELSLTKETFQSILQVGDQYKEWRRAAFQYHSKWKKERIGRWECAE